MTILSQSQVYNYARAAGLTNMQAQIAASIAMAESGGDTNAINSSNVEYSVGLWQINTFAHPQYSINQLKDPSYNASAMYAVSSGGTNWNPWTTYTNGAYKKFVGNLGTVSGGGASGTGSAIDTILSGSVDTLSSTVKANPVAFTAVGSAWKYILAYTIAILIFVFIARFEAGYNALYYLAVLTLMLIVLTESRFIYEALAPITGQTQQQTTQTVLL